MNTLTVTPETFTSMLLDLIKSGVIFQANETPKGIVVTFTGGY